MITLITILSVTVVILGYTTFNLLHKNEKQEDMLEQQNNILTSYQSYLNKLSDTIEVADKKLQEVDQKGSFKADDEIGFVFEQVKTVQTILNTFIIKELK
jgi:dihydrofolate reductase